jgi:ubiquinone/menaquinone biosynthesis C-methylase UbiE
MNLAKNTPDCADVETSSMNYAQRFAGPTGKWLIGVQCSILKDLLNDFNGTESVLDVGGGHGQVVNCLLNSRYKVTVLGSTEKCTVQIESHLKNQTCLFSLGHPENIPYPDKSFDVVTCFRYLSHTEEWQKVISELCRVAKYAVIVVLTCYHQLCLNLKNVLKVILAHLASSRIKKLIQPS